MGFWTDARLVAPHLSAARKGDARASRRSVDIGWLAGSGSIVMVDSRREINDTSQPETRIYINPTEGRRCRISQPSRAIAGPSKTAFTGSSTWPSATTKPRPHRQCAGHPCNHAAHNSKSAQVRSEQRFHQPQTQNCKPGSQIVRHRNPRKLPHPFALSRARHLLHCRKKTASQAPSR